MKIKYLLLMLVCLSISVNFVTAQNPGGLSTAPNFWVKSDNAVTYDGSNNVSAWQDNISAVGNTVANPTAGTQPLYEEVGLNYNPSLSFDGNNDYLEYGLDGSTPNSLGNSNNQYEAFIVVQANNRNSVFYYGRGYGGSNTTPPAGRAIGLNHINSQPKNGVTIRYIHERDAELSGFPIYTPYVNNIKSSLNAADNVMFSLNGANLQAPDDSSGGAQNYPTSPANQAIVLGATTRVRSTDFLLSYYEGKVSEIIYYFGAFSSDAERHRVRSYLAYKYGITLDQSIALNQTYLASDGTTAMWTNDGTYVNNIFGIGRDDNTYLNQKISHSTNIDTNGDLTDILTVATNNDFTSSNIDGSRTPVSVNNSYLSFSNNGASKDISGAIIEAPTIKRLARIWKVQKTANFTQDVALKFEGYNSNWTLVKSTTDDFNPSNITVLGTLDNSGVIANVPMVDGEYFTLYQYVSPGGIAGNLSLWMRGDLGVTESGTISDWDDISPAQTIVTPRSTAITYGTDDVMNFNAYADLSGAQDEYFFFGDTDYMNNTTVDLYSFFFVGKKNTPTDFSHLFFNSNTVTSNNAYNSLHGGGGVLQYGVSNGVVHPQVSDDTAQWYYNGLNVSKGQSFGDTPFIVGFDLPTGNPNGPLQVANMSHQDRVTPSQLDRNWKGPIAEVIFYQKNQTPIELQKIQSYLALKYGITLDQSTPYNYVNALGDAYWTNDGAYVNNIFGIGRDDVALLNQLVSRSVNNTFLTIATSNDFTNLTTDSGRDAIDTDNTFLVISDNGDVLDDSGSTGFLGVSYLKEFANVWKAQDTGDTGCTHLQFDFTGSTLDGTTKRVFLFLADDDGFTTNVEAKELTITSNKATVEGINFSDGNSATSTYFTLATIDSNNLPGVGVGTVGINTLETSYNPTKDFVLLDIYSAEKGIVVSRVTNDTDITDPQEGMLIYDITAKIFKVNTDGTPTGWRALGDVPAMTSKFCTE